MRKLILPLASIAALSACAGENINWEPGVGPHGSTAAGTMGGRADTGGMGGMANMGDMTPTAAMPYMAMAASSDLYEIQSAQIAMQKSQRADIRSMSQMLMEHHQMSSQQLMAAAQAGGMNPPQPMLMPMHQQLIDQLQAAGPGEFDMVFMRQQVMAHEMALNLHSNYARSGDTPALRTVASAIVPVVTQHLNQARAMMR